MYRDALFDLVRWKDRPDRKPLLLYGARQVGKTWLVREFGQQYFKQWVELNCFKKEHAAIFAKSIEPAILVREIELALGIKIDPATTLLFFDEIQESGAAMDSLKFFNDQAPQYHIIAAGSFLGVAARRFPVGQVNCHTLYPMNFCEFLRALQHDAWADLIEQGMPEDISDALRARLEEVLREYFYVGGMPAVVREYVKEKNLSAVRDVQAELLNGIRGDFIRHIPPVETHRVRMIWDSLPLQLGRDNKKFKYSLIKPGGKATEFELALQWLKDTGLIYQVHRVENPDLPLSMHYRPKHFKVYAFDLGILGALGEVIPNTFLLGQPDLIQVKSGSFAEQFVLQELKCRQQGPHYYWAREKPASAEIDYLLEIANLGIVPLEVKSGHQTKAKSLTLYRQHYHPRWAVRTSLNQGRTDGVVHDIPLYMIGQLGRLAAEK